MTKEALEALIRTLEFWGLIFGVIVVIGVGGESVVGIRIWRNSRKLQAILHTEEQQREQRIAELNKEAAQLRKDADILEAQIAPRRLDLAQQSKIATNCRGFKNLFVGKRIKVVSYTLDTEGFVLAEQVVKALRDSGMVVDDDAMSIMPTMGTLVFGINVFGPDAELAKKIAEAIGSSGKPVAVGFVTNDPTADTMRFETANSRLPHEATVLVGLKMPDPNTISELNRVMPATKPSH